MWCNSKPWFLLLQISRSPSLLVLWLLQACLSISTLSHQNWGCWTLIHLTKSRSSSRPRSNFRTSSQMPNDFFCVFLWVSVSSSSIGMRNQRISVLCSLCHEKLECSILFSKPLQWLWQWWLAFCWSFWRWLVCFCQSASVGGHFLVDLWTNESPSLSWWSFAPLWQSDQWQGQLLDLTSPILSWSQLWPFSPVMSFAFFEIPTCQTRFSECAQKSVHPPYWSKIILHTVHVPSRESH